jgi:hypothetical protein
MAALVVAPAALPRNGTASRVVRFVNVPAGAAKTATVSCPAGSVAASAGVQSPGMTRTLAIRPPGARAFAIRLSNSGANPPQRTSVAVSCLRLPSGVDAPHFQARQVHSKRLAVPAGGQKQASLGCPSGTLAAGAGFDFSGAPLELRRSTRTLNRFSFTVRNGGGRAWTAVLYGTCLTLLRPPGSRHVSLRERVITTTTPLPPGDQTVNQACPSGWFGLATGYSLPPSGTVSGSVALPAGGRWTLTNPLTKPVLADLQLACGRVA